VRPVVGRATREFIYSASAAGTKARSLSALASADYWQGPGTPGRNAYGGGSAR
jgi:hypothetical protein